MQWQHRDGGNNVKGKQEDTCLFDVSNLVTRVEGGRVELRGVCEHLEGSTVGTSGQVSVSKAFIPRTAKKN